MIDMQDLLCVLKVAEEKSITAAANKLFLTQSAVSQKVTKVEKELGLALFIRTNRSVELTDAGVFFVTKASALNSSWEDFFLSMEQFSSMDKNQCSVGLPALINFTEIPDLLAGFTMACPNYQLTTFPEFEDSKYKNLLNGKLDFCFDRGSVNAPKTPKYITAVPLRNDTLSLLLHKDDPLTKKSLPVRSSDLTGYHMLINAPHNTHDVEKAAQITYSVCHDSASPSMITKPGIFIPLPQSVCTRILAQSPHLRAVAFEDDMPISLSLLYRTDRQNIENHPFYRYVLNYYQTQQE